GDGYAASISGNQSSALLTALHRGNCLISLPEGTDFVPAGEIVTCIRLDMEEGTA
ncbi:molybdopterin molybdenumtransferase MoeA, partial [bacterium]|nr:molybdopterin molybdenumtransferase MoeA [bacterium]